MTGLEANAGESTILNYNYTYLLDGNQISKTNLVTQTITEYTYDAQDRLTSENTRFYNNESMAPDTDVYWYDMMGNRTLKTEYRRTPETPTEQTARFVRSTYNKANQLIESYDSATHTETAFTYDSRGNLLTDGNSARTYNQRNRQTSFSDGETTTNYTYYVDGLRKSKKIGNGETQNFIWHNGNMVYEFTNSDSNTYAYGLQIFASDDTRYLLNAHGDVVALLDASGDVTKRYEYDAFGNELNIDESDDNPFRYCGEYFDNETGTIYLRARYYNPTVGRFSTVDPIRDGLNWYAYCYNNPITFFDPVGLIPTPLEAAHMAKHIYDATDEDINGFYGNQFGGWTLKEIITGNEGLCMGVYYREIDGGTEYALVNKGTESSGDWVNNFQQPFGTSTDMIDSIQYAKSFVESHAGCEITMVGHSKGGAEAVANAVATNTNCIVFNPATTFLSSYGLDSSDYTADMVAYVVKGEALNAVEGWFSKPIDEVINLQQMYPTWTILPNEVRFANSIKNHGMNSVIFGLYIEEWMS